MPSCLAMLVISNQIVSSIKLATSETTISRVLYSPEAKETAQWIVNSSEAAEGTTLQQTRAVSICDTQGHSHSYQGAVQLAARQLREATPGTYLTPLLHCCHQESRPSEVRWQSTENSGGKIPKSFCFPNAVLLRSLGKEVAQKASKTTSEVNVTWWEFTPSISPTVN